MRISLVFFEILASLALISSSSAAIVPSLQSISQSSNTTFPLLNEDLGFGIRGHYGENNLNIISILINTVNSLAQLAHQPFQKRIPVWRMEPLAWYPGIEMSIQPVRPARDVEVQVAITALYHAVLDMINNKAFKNGEFDILWNSVVVAQLVIGKGAGPSLTVRGIDDTSLVSTKQNTIPLNSTVSIILTARNQGLRLYFEYAPSGEKLTFQEVFITLMAALKGLSQFPSTQVVEPYRTGARGYSARMQFFGTETPRAEPPFLTYALLIDTVREIAFHALEKKKFAELHAVVVYDDEIVGEAVLEKGSPN